MQSLGNESSGHKVIRPNRLIKHSQSFLATGKWRLYQKNEEEDVASKSTTALPRLGVTPRPQLWEDPSQHDLDDDIPIDVFDIGSMSTMRLMEVSGMLRAVRPLTEERQAQLGSTPTVVDGVVHPSSAQQAGTRPFNHYAGEMFGQTALLPSLPDTPLVVEAASQSWWKRLLNTTAARVVLGLLLGIGMLFLISLFVDIPTTISLLRQHLTTKQGVVFALLAAASFITAFSIRGMRWRLFLSLICKISILKAVQIFWVAVFLNFLLPVQGGEVAKSLILKRIKGVPISRSLPTVAMDKSLDLLPALFIMALVPFIPGIHMSATLWIILSLVSSILLGIIFTVALMAWNRSTATKFIQIMLKVLPKGIGERIEGFALGFIDSLLAGASSPRTFIPALLLTCLAITCDGLFAWFAFLAVGVSSMGFGTAIFGYITYTMFSILPNPPGQVGSNELAGVLVFSGLLGFPKSSILAMFVFSHPLAALIMTTMCLLCLSGLGLSLTSATTLNAKTKSV